ncbi:MAG TPA: DUF4908 domain-containing protein [Caulobacteraceae bacterium]|nr:DUF4908 domain-containing protein [Caulobacteraceae bacterium]
MSSSAAAAPLTLRAALMGAEGQTPAGPLVARYQSDDGGVFILDRSRRRPLLKFADSPEIWALKASGGPRGDIIYRDDVGDMVLRATKLGGVTVFTEKRPDGSAAALEGPSAPLRIQPIGPQALFEHFYQASVRATRAAQHLVEFENREDAAPAVAGLLADAALVASEALVDIAAHPGGKVILTRIRDVVIAQGARPDASLQRGVLTVTVAPSQGVAGRPSSRRVERAAGASPLE